MGTSNHHNSQLQRINPSWPQSSHHYRHESKTQIRIKIQIPRHYSHEPVISHLTAKYGLLVNITGALLGASSQGEGWFDLELRGIPQQIQSALTYLRSLDIKVWGKPNPDGDGW